MLTMIVPNLIALAQDSVKRMLAYSSIAHAGYLLIGVVAASELGRSASLFYLAAYALMTIGSFAVVFHVAGKGDRRSLVDDYRGLGWRRPGLAAALLVFLFSLAGFPPTAGFVGKLFLLQAAVEAGETALAVTLVMTSLVAYYYYLRVIWKMYFDQAADDLEVPRPARGGLRAAIGICVLLLLLGGLFPGRVIDRVEEAVSGNPSAVAGASR
jgi:NADH-quinone oxidoreductase subunit N